MGSALSSRDNGTFMTCVLPEPEPGAWRDRLLCEGGLGDAPLGRMYPITFRRFADRRLKKYIAIECLATRPRNDSRPEKSLRIDKDSIELVGNPVSTVNGLQRHLTMLPEPSTSFEAIRGAHAPSATPPGLAARSP